MTLRLTDDEFNLALKPKAAEPELSRIPPGHWRVVYRFTPADIIENAPGLVDGWEVLEPGIARGPARFVSADIAETTARKWCVQANRFFGCHVCEFLRAEFFAGEAP